VVLGDPGSDLPEAADEAVAVARMLDTEPLRGDAATSAVLRAAARADVLHLATHAGFTDRGAWIELADGRVDASTVLRWGLRPRLAVLASCTSAAQRVAGMWGSLAAAFLAAGSEAVLATLWSVDDEIAHRFVLRFYREGGARAPAQALARAQRAFAAAGEPPSMWAPFVLVGAPAPGE
jgi:CHAT domain-containing protein